MECSPTKINTNNMDPRPNVTGFACTEAKEENKVQEVIKSSEYLSEAQPNFLGRHIIAEFFQADFDALNDAPKLEAAMEEAAKAAGASVLSSHKHFFEPHGVSAVIIIQESNLCIHTWPEFGYAAADFFTCGDTVNPWKSFEYLKNFLKATKFNCMELQRGSTELINNPSLMKESVVRGESLPKDSKLAKIAEATEAKMPNFPSEKRRSKFQKTVVAKNKWWGNVLWLDDVLNVTERDEFVYHEMISHVPMMTHPDPKRVLIVGGGDGGVATEVLKHASLEKVTIVEIEEDLVNGAKKLNEETFADPRLNLIIGNAAEYVKE